MRRYIRFFAPIALLPLLFAAAAPSAAPASQPAKQPGMIWKATSPTTTVYLLGSIHAATPDMYPLPVEMESAFHDAKVLAVEVDITKINQLALAMKMLSTGMYKGDDSLEKHVPADTWKKLEAFAKDENVSITALNSMKPWLAGVTLQGVAATSAGLDPANGIDMHFLKEDKGKKVVEFETADSQLDMLANLTDDEQQEMLDLDGNDAKQMKEMLDKLVAAWRAGDDKAVLDVEKDAETGGAAGKSIMKKLIDDRNGPMADKIEKMAAEKDPVFVVVGAAHLLGNNGILALLQKKGLKVERVMVTPPPHAVPASAPATAPATAP